MFLFAGLGNPGSSYGKNRHNIGFMVIDAIYARYHFSFWSNKFQALVTNGMISSEKILLIKPQTFMNLSGQVIGEIMRFYRLVPNRLIVIHDELDLPQGKVRIRKNGGSGGHNGIKSIDAHCGKNYCRMRLGIGHPGHKDLVSNHVLGNFSKTDSVWLEPLLAIVADHIDLIIRGNNTAFMNRMTACFPQKETKI